MSLSLSIVERALNLAEFDGEAAQAHMQPVPRARRRPPHQPGRARQGAVLMLLYCSRGEIHLVLTRRRDDLQAHAGQVSLPGGSREGSEALSETALRETLEEVGVSPEAITILGALTPVYILPSDFTVQPFVGWHPSTPAFTAQPAEVAEIIEVPLSLLLQEETRHDEVWQWGDRTLDVPYYLVGEHKVWGATAMMLSEFLSRIERALDQERDNSSGPDGDGLNLDGDA